MIKYFIRHYWRYLAMALAFTTISFLVNSCEVKAENEIYSQTLNYDARVNTRENIVYNNTNGVLATGGRGTLIFNVATVEKSSNTSFYTPTVQEVTINTYTDIYTCEIGSTSTTYYEEENYKANVYTAVCEINIGDYGIRQIKVKMNDTPSGYFWLKTSQYMTFVKNTDVGTQHILSAIQNMLNTYLGNINISDATTATNTGTTNAYLQSIQNILNTNFTSIIQAINNQSTQAHQDAQAQKEATDNINDSINDSTVEDPDSDLEDMQENEISNSVISDLLLLPINMFENIIDAIGGTCSSFSLGALFGTTLVLPCIDIPSLIGNNLWSVIDVLFCGIFVLSIRKKFVDIFENITSLKDRGNELE